jgi:AraC family transcriptional regulator
MNDFYSDRAQRVVDHVRRHLDGDLSLATLAKVACFSPYHFHRIFKATTGETAADLVRRARLERAVLLMRGAPSRSLTGIALEAGFATPSELSRVFRHVYGVAPSRWDRNSRLDGVRDCAADAREAASHVSLPEPLIREHRAVRVAYVRVRDPWSGPGALAEGYETLTGWLDGKRVDWRSGTLLGLSWDSDLATPVEALVYDLGFVVPHSIGPAGRVGVCELPAVVAAEVRCDSLREVVHAWDLLYRWLRRSRFEPDHVPAVKRFTRAPEVFDADAWHVDCSIAIRRRRP